MIICPEHAYASRKVKDTVKQSASEITGMSMFFNSSGHVKAMHQLYAYYKIKHIEL